MSIKTHPFLPHSSFNGGTLDCGNGLLLLIRKHIDPLNPGELLEIISLDSSVEEDLPAWCRLTNNELVSLIKNGPELSFLVSKGPFNSKMVEQVSGIKKIQSCPTSHLNPISSPTEPLTVSTYSVMGLGSWPRPFWLLKILHEYLESKIEEKEFNTACEDSIRLCVQMQEESGADVITDGEQRRDNYSSFIGNRLTNCQLIPLTDLLAFVDDPEHFAKELKQLDVPASSVRHPAVFGKIRREKPIALHEAQFLRSLTNKPIKIALPGPYLLARTMWMECISDSHYASREDLAEDICRVLREELSDLIKFGVEIVQFDEPVLSEVAFAPQSLNRTFMCGALGEKKPILEELQFAAQLLKKVTSDFPKDRIAVHICRGNWTKDESKSLAGPYDSLLPYFEAIEIGTLFLEFSTPRAGEIKFLTELKNRFNLGIGLVNQKLETIESDKDIVIRIHQIQQLLGNKFSKKLFLTPDCGFATFADSPISSNEIAKLKLKILKSAQFQLTNQAISL